MNSDILLWPNFISDRWTKYYMYSEMPASVSTAGFNAVPFVGKQENSIFKPIIYDKDDKQPDRIGHPVYLTEDSKILSDKGIRSTLLVTADHRVNDIPYKYEIYQSNKPFAGVKLTSGIDRNGNEQIAGFLLIRYAKGTCLNNMMASESPFQERGVTLGFDFGSTNSSVAYYDPEDTKTKGLELQNRRVSLFGNDGDDGPNQPKDFFFFSKKPTLSNALKSMLVLHDPRRMPSDNALRKTPVAGGLPCFMNNLPLKAVTSFTISLDFGNGVDATIINNMKWSTKEFDKEYKTAYLSTLLLMVYAELFDFKGRDGGQKRLWPEKLNWSYPSTMEGSTIQNHYNPIWCEELGKDKVSPIIDENESVKELKVAIFKGQKDDIYASSTGLGGISYNTQQSEDDFDFGVGVDFLSKNAMESGRVPKPRFMEDENEEKDNKEIAIDFTPEDPKKHLEFKEVKTDSPMTEACASANNTAQTYDAQNTIVYCFDVGGSTTDISAIFKRDGVKASMVKQNSIRFAAQKISQAVRENPDEFKKALSMVCENYKIQLIGFNAGEPRYNADTASYYYEQIVDMLDGEQLKYFYGRIAEYCPRLFAVNMYVTGLIMFYAGQLFMPLYNAILANLEGAPKSAYKGGVDPISGVQIVFAGKGARIFDWLSVRDLDMAVAYFRTMFKAGAGIKMKNDSIQLTGLHNGKSNKDVKFEVSKGLASENGNIEAPKESFEIFGENGFKGYSADGTVYDYSFDTKLTPEWMRLIGSGFIRQPQPNSQCFTQFLSIYVGAIQKVLGIGMDRDEIIRGLEQMRIVQYLTQEVPRFKEAMERYRNDTRPDDQKKFDYVAPIIILEGMKFYDKHLLKCFKK